MTSSNRSDTPPNPAVTGLAARCFRLQVIAVPDEHVVQALTGIIENHIASPNPLFGIVRGEMELNADLGDFQFHQAEKLARSLMRESRVLRLSGRCFADCGRELFAIKLFKPQTDLNERRSNAETS